MKESFDPFGEMPKPQKIEKFSVDDCFNLNIGKLDKAYLRDCIKNNIECQELATIVIPGRGINQILLYYRYVIKEERVFVILRYQKNDTGPFISQYVEMVPKQNRVFARWYFLVNGARLTCLYLKPHGRYWGSRTSLNLIYHLQTINPRGRFGKLAKLAHWERKINEFPVNIGRDVYRGKPTKNLTRYMALREAHRNNTAYLR
jgi:hypothetical protein